jgi:hypothetical protein
MHYIIIGVTFIATFLSQMVTTLFTSWLQVATKRFFIIAAVLAAMATFVGGFYLAMRTIIESIALVSPPFLNQAASLVVPDNFVTLVAIQITARIIRFAYEWNVKVLQWRL